MADADHLTLDVQHDEPGNRYVLRRAGEDIGILEYRPVGDVLEVLEVRIFPGIRGEGLGGVLARDALLDVREHGRKVHPSCWYLKSFIEGNPEFADLVADLP
ncbi:MAG: GNAT family N-acetyltransferase [Acidimicrobiia bacterium]